MISRKWRDEDRPSVNDGNGWLAVILLFTLLMVITGPLRGQPINWTCKPGQTAVWVNGQPGCNTVLLSRVNTSVAPYPGYWHANSVAIPHWAPCPNNGLHAYTAFVDPDTGNQGYFRYDFSSYRFPLSTCPGGSAAPCLFASAGGPNHSTTWLDLDGYEKPLWAQQQPPNYYPVPVGTTALCPAWLQVGNTAACPGTENYVNAMQNNPVYSAGYQINLPKIQSDPGCQSGAVTATPTVVRTPTPAITPTPAPNPFAQQIEAITRAGITKGCGNDDFCPTRYMTRQEVAAWLAKALNLPLLACQGVYKDVPCPMPGFKAVQP